MRAVRSSQLPRRIVWADPTIHYLGHYLLSLSSLLLRGLQTVKLIDISAEKLIWDKKKINIFPLGGPLIGSAHNACLVNCGLLTALMRFHSDLAQEVNWAGLPRIHAWSIVCSSVPSQDVALPPNLPFWGELFLRSYFPTGHCWATPADPRPGGSSSFIEEWFGQCKHVSFSLVVLKVSLYFFPFYINRFSFHI